MFVTSAAVSVAVLSVTAVLLAKLVAVSSVLPVAMLVAVLDAMLVATSIAMLVAISVVGPAVVSAFFLSGFPSLPCIACSGARAPGLVGLHLWLMKA